MPCEGDGSPFRNVVFQTHACFLHYFMFLASPVYIHFFIPFVYALERNHLCCLTFVHRKLNISVVASAHVVLWEGKCFFYENSSTLWLVLCIAVFLLCICRDFLFLPTLARNSQFLAVFLFSKLLVLEILLHYPNWSRSHICALIPAVQSLGWCYSCLCIKEY